VAASIVVIAIAILPFLTPAWVSFEQGRTHAASLAGYSDADLTLATNAILHDLVLGPPDFAVEVGGVPVLEPREREHMRDVRGVFAGFFLIAGVAAAVLVTLALGARRSGHAARAWSAIAVGMRWLIVGIVVTGVIASIAFDALFEIFHRLFFPAGSFTFDPRTDHLVQLFPFDFWSETTIVLGVVIVAIAAVVSVVGGRRAARSGGHATAPAVVDATVADPVVDGRIEAAR
jgi:integral membrane protein (TIGR01906 family)